MKRGTTPADIGALEADAGGLAIERWLALAVAAASVAPALTGFAGETDRIALLVRSLIPALVLVTAVLAPVPAALAVTVLALAATAVAAVARPAERPMFMVSGLIVIVAAGGQLAAARHLRPRLIAVSGSPVPATRVASPPPPRAAARPRTASAPPIARPGGWHRLSLRQTEVLDLMLAGLTAQLIGDRLGISKRTVETHVAAGYAKLGMADGRHLMLRCRMLDRELAGAPQPPAADSLAAAGGLDADHPYVVRMPVGGLRHAGSTAGVGLATR